MAKLRHKPSPNWVILDQEGNTECLMDHYMTHNAEYIVSVATPIFKMGEGELNKYLTDLHLRAEILVLYN